MQYATEIKVRAERRCGELLASTGRKRGATVRGQMAVERHDTHSPTLSDMGLTRDESSRYQQLAAMPADHCETAVATAKATAGEVRSAFMLREAMHHAPAGDGRHLISGATPGSGPSVVASLQISATLARPGYVATMPSVPTTAHQLGNGTGWPLIDHGASAPAFDCQWEGEKKLRMGKQRVISPRYPKDLPPPCHQDGASASIRPFLIGGG